MTGTSNIQFRYAWVEIKKNSTAITYAFISLNSSELNIFS